MGSFAGTCEIVEEKEDLCSVIYTGRTILQNSGLSIVDKDLENPVLKLGYKGSLEDDINQLFESISIKASGMGSSHQVGTSTSTTSRSTSPLGKNNNAMKKPVNAPRSPGNGTSEPVSLKQALRDLCISKASEMAAMKRISEAGRIKNLYGSVLVESGSGSGIHVDESKALMVEVLEESRNNSSENISQQLHVLKIKPSSQSGQTSPRFAAQTTHYSSHGIMLVQNGIDSVSRKVGHQESKTDILQKANNVFTHSESHRNSEDEVLGLDGNVPSSTKSANEMAAPKSVRKVRLLHKMPTSSTTNSKRVGKLTRNSPRVAKPVLRNKVSVKKKVKQGPNPANVYDEVDGFFDPITKQLLCHRCHCALRSASKEEDDHNSLTSDNVSHSPKVGLDNLNLDVKGASTEETKQDIISSGNKNSCVINAHAEEKFEGVRGLVNKNSDVMNSSTETNQDSLASLFVDNTAEAGSDSVNTGLKNTSKEVNKDSLSLTTGKEVSNSSIPLLDHSAQIGPIGESSAETGPGSPLKNPHTNEAVVEEENENLMSRGKGEPSQSSKDSIGEYSTSTSISDESNMSRSSFGNRPHMSKDVRWEAIQHVRMQHGVLGLRHFNLLKKLGCGDIGTVYLAELIGTNCLFAIKVMDNEFLARRNKMPRAQTEREILRMLDHPFLPTLYSHFTSDNLSCLVMEYCPGGDLHVLRQKQPARCFPEPAARFYVAEVLLASEYLHMLGVIYRDLKPENILVREDGHIMVTDFDLSLRCTVSPTLLKSSSRSHGGDPVRISGHATQSSCMEPLCIQPSLRVACFSPKLSLTTKKGKKTRKLKKSELLNRFRSFPQLVAEPTDARSNSFVGTHEYLAPEIIKGEGHGAAVDWWTFGIFLYELLYGKTPFKGTTNEETLANVVLQNLKFPENPLVSFQAKDLIRGLLVKEPENRLGSEKGAAEIKRHPFFEGLNWALIRCAIPPELPDCCEYGVSNLVSHESRSNYLECKAIGEHLEFELF